MWLLIHESVYKPPSIDAFWIQLSEIYGRSSIPLDRTCIGCSAGSSAVNPIWSNRTGAPKLPAAPSWQLGLPPPAVPSHSAVRF